MGIFRRTHKPSDDNASHTDAAGIDEGITYRHGPVIHPFITTLIVLGILGIAIWQWPVIAAFFYNCMETLSSMQPITPQP